MTAYPPLQQHQHGPPLRHLHGQSQGSTNKLDAAVSSSLRCGGLPTDARGLRAVIKSLSPSAAGASSKASAVHGHAAKLGLDHERTVCNALISLYLASGDPAAARALFDAFPNGRDVVSWTAMVTGLTRLGFSDSAASLFLAMMEEEDDDIEVDAVAAAAGFAACADAGDLALGRVAHRRVEHRQVPLDAVARNALIDMYARCGDLATARRLFNAVPLRKRNVVTWNTMIAALTRAGGGAHAGDALALFREMQTQQHVQPDAATLVAVLGACARLGALDTSMWVHAYHITRLGRNPNDDGGGAVVVANALIDMYAKCGAVDHAVAVFDAVSRRDAYTYASMITGLAAHGRAHDALSLFHAMPTHLGVRPNAVTLLGALSACCHAGLVDEGLSILRGMEDGSHGVVPAIEHYGCAVDMLGRAGRLDEAEALVAAMPMPPDAAVYGSLMAACRARGDVERAERVMRAAVAAGGRQLDAGDHVLMANTYAAKGRHGRALRVRKEMRESKIVKDPGCSLIEIDGVVHEFTAVPANSSIT